MCRSRALPRWPRRPLSGRILRATGWPPRPPRRSGPGGSRRRGRAPRPNCTWRSDTPACCTRRRSVPTPPSAPRQSAAPRRPCPSPHRVRQIRPHRVFSVVGDSWMRKRKEGARIRAAERCLILSIYGPSPGCHRITVPLGAAGHHTASSNVTGRAKALASRARYSVAADFDRAESRRVRRELLDVQQRVAARAKCSTRWTNATFEASRTR